MKNLYRNGNTAFNDGLNLPVGHLSIDNEKKALRFYDGSTQGGFEASGVRAFTPPVGPGHELLVAGTMDAGFFGEVTSEELFTYESLANQIGLSAGTSQFNDESLWLKFALDNQILYVAKKTARHTVPWDHIQAVGAVHEGNTQVSVGSHLLDVTLLRGAASDPTVQGPDGLWLGYDIDLSNGSEWNRLMYPIHSGVHGNANNPSVHTDPNSEPFGSWATYSDSDLVLVTGNGRVSWTQEVSGDNSSRRVYRGNLGVTYLNRNTSSPSTSRYGWRPCLRLVV